MILPMTNVLCLYIITVIILVRDLEGCEKRGLQIFIRGVQNTFGICYVTRVMSHFLTNCTKYGRFHYIDARITGNG